MPCLSSAVDVLIEFCSQSDFLIDVFTLVKFSFVEETSSQPKMMKAQMAQMKRPT